MVQKPKQVFSLVEISEHTGLSIPQLRNMIREQRLEVIQPGGQRNSKLFVKRSELERLLQPVKAQK